MEEYTQKCRNIDDTSFSLSEKQIEKIQLDDFDEIHRAFSDKMRECKLQDAAQAIVNVQRLSLKRRGKGNQLIVPRVSGKSEGSFIMRLRDDMAEVLSVEKIFGVRDESGEVSWVAFFGPVWEVQRSDTLFEVFEFNARQHFEGRKWWGIDEVALPCWVRHIHRCENVLQILQSITSVTDFPRTNSQRCVGV